MSNESNRTIQLLTDRLTYCEDAIGKLRRDNFKLRAGKWVSIVLFIGSAFMMFVAIGQAAVCR